MKSILSSVLIALIVCLNFNVFSRNPVNIKNSEKANPARMDAEACFPATASTELYVNNVRTVIMTGGDMWWDLKSVPKYIIPATGKTCSMFSASLWIGGIDINGQLKVCAQTYRNSGNDFWPGPLTTDGTASVDATTCKKYDRHFAITRNEVAQFVTDASKVTQVIKEWPGNGDVTKGQDQFLAPFVDKNGDGIYNWQDGDYPAFDIDGKNPCSDNMLFGDKTLWWVFNDKGNVHTQTNGSPIGMEIRAQAFAFSTNDDINNMTFYNYKLINRSTYTLTQTFFSQWIDTDIGDATDDFVGCDVTRGLAYGYNGDDYDGTGLETHYGANPPACGSDFFQGPYMDKDGIDNPAYSATMTYKNDQYTLASINGEGFGDGIVDNERFGMRRFVYHSNPSYGNPNNAITDPSTAIEYYNLLRSIWKDGTKMLYGGTGHYSDPKAKGPECDYMFPDDTDPRGWGTGGVPQAPWSEKTNNNKPGDRRYMQSAGPFTLEPGAVNYITVGIPWARASAGGAWASVQLLKVADDKCQRLFDNCFKVVNGPDAPDLTITELNRKLILTLSNENVLSNNYHEKYKEFDFNIVTPADYRTAHNGKGYDSLYRFEGYQIYQLANANVSVSDLHDVSLARLVAQCDIKNGISKLINYTHDASLNANVPVQEVDGADKGISHTFVVSEDLFSTGDKSLVNNKKYYFIAIAYAYNQYLPYSDDPTILNGLLGQKTPYKASRKSATGQILPVSAVPHIPEAENNGTIMQSDYGFGPKITRIEGQGNGGQILELTDASINKILSDGKILTPEYKNSEGPVNVKVVDPLNVLGGDFTLKFLPTKTTSDPTIGLNEAGWELDFIPNGGNAQNRKVWFSDKSIKVANEQVIPEVGLSIFIEQVSPIANNFNVVSANAFLKASMTFSDSTHKWLSGLQDIDGDSYFNWIRSGNYATTIQNATEEQMKWDDATYTDAITKVTKFIDENKVLGSILNGTWAPYRLCSDILHGPKWKDRTKNESNRIANIASVNIVITPDKSKWSRCPIIELADNEDDGTAPLSEGNAKKFNLRRGQSVGKDGKPDGTGTGMGWFPGYAINVETGERLNIMFGEDSWYMSYNGRDMIWNPTTIYSNVQGEPIMGGKHFIYVMGHNGDDDKNCPAYDGGTWCYNTLLSGEKFDYIKRYVYNNVMWVSVPMLTYGEKLLSNEVTIKIRVAKPYEKNYSTYGSSTPQNDDYPMYKFNTSDIKTILEDYASKKDAMDNIKVVPNPYYAYSAYETSQIDNRVRITNLPPRCDISIYSLNGVLIRKLSKDDQVTYLDWDLKNYAGIPISSGIYLFHIYSNPNSNPNSGAKKGDGHKIIKWFATMRPIDLNAY